MNINQLKKIFFDAFNLVANAINARKLMKDKGITIVRKDFRCKKTWEQLLDAFGLLDSWKSFEKKREAKKTEQVFKQRQQSFVKELNKEFATVGVELPDLDSPFWDDEYL